LKFLACLKVGGSHDAQAVSRDVVRMAAVGNAVHDAVGVRIASLPITPAKVLAALERAARGAR